NGRLDAEHRERERWLLYGDRSPAQPAHSPPGRVANTRARRKMQLQARHAWRRDNRLAADAGRDSNLVTVVQRGHPNHVRQDCRLARREVDARFEAPIASAGAMGSRAIDNQYLVPGRDVTQLERAVAVTLCAMPGELE